MTEHTPGPWIAVHRHVHAGPNDDEMDGLGWEIEGPPDASNRGQFRRAADARLIAAAPDLLTALKRLVDSGGMSLTGNAYLPGPEVVSQAKAAIAKAVAP